MIHRGNGGDEAPVDAVEQLASFLGGQHRGLAAPNDVLRPAYRCRRVDLDNLAHDEPIEFAETRAYVKRVEHLKSIYRDAWHSKLYVEN